MGNFISEFFDGITGKTGAEAATKAGDIQAQASLAGTDELRRQFDITQNQLAPFLQAGTQALGGVQEGSTVAGLDQMLQEIMGGGAFGSLVDERQRSVQGQLAAGGLTRSGAGLEAASAIPTDLAFQLENLLFGRNQGLATMGQNTAVGAGQLGQQSAQGISSGINQAAQAQASGILGGAQAQAAGTQSLLNLGGTLGAAKLISMSDPRLKENIREIGMIGPLTLVEWDWKPEFKDTFVSRCGTMGFMSTDIKEHFPEYVSEIGGYDAVHYGELLDKLDSLEVH